VAPFVDSSDPRDTCALLPREWLPEVTIHAGAPH